MRLRPILMILAAALVVLAGFYLFHSTRPSVPPPVQGTADRILVEKAARQMTLLRDGRIIRSYRVALGSGGLGPKQRAGDGKVPEGIYRITGRNPGSAYHLSLRIGYPTPAQTRAARQRGVDPGGDIMIHGLPNGMAWMGSNHRLRDWTLGCIAVTNDEIEEIWRLVPDQTVIEIRA